MVVKIKSHQEWELNHQGSKYKRSVIFLLAFLCICKNELYRIVQKSINNPKESDLNERGNY